MRILIAALVIYIYNHFIFNHLKWTFLQGSCSLLKRLQLIDPTKKRPKSRQKEWREKSMLSLQIFRLTEILFACRRLDVQVPDATDQNSWNRSCQLHCQTLSNRCECHRSSEVTINWMSRVTVTTKCLAQQHASILSCSPFSRGTIFTNQLYSVILDLHSSDSETYKSNK